MIVREERKIEDKEREKREKRERKEREKERERGGWKTKKAFFCLQGRNTNYIPAGTKGFW
jgi:hypothetical protein